jgi:hypothetical protein
MNTDDQAASRYSLLRWLAVIPAAILAGWITHVAFGLVSMVVVKVLPESISYYVRLLLCYAPQNACFVIVGAKIAPRQLVTAVALAAAAIAMSLLVHILGQRTVGVTNCLHFTAETAGAVLGATLAYATKRTRWHAAT